MVAPPPHQGGDLREYAGARFYGLSLIGETEILHPNLPQELNSRHLTQPCWCIRGCDRREQLMTIAPDLLGMGAPLRLALRHVTIACPSAIALQPDRIGIETQPIRGRGRQAIQ